MTRSPVTDDGGGEGRQQHRDAETDELQGRHLLGVRHARVPDRFFEVVLTCDGEKAVEVEVLDASSRLPECREASPEVEAESGRGLPLVAAPAESWELRGRVVGRTVWARVLTR